MRQVFWIATAALIGSALGAPLRAQAVCRSADEVGTRFRGHIARYSSAAIKGDAQVRDSLRLASSSAANVTLVTSESVCKKANATYQAELGGVGGSPFSGKVYVVKAGTTYAVLDPSFHYQGRTNNWIIVIMDSRYKKLSLF